MINVSMMQPDSRFHTLLVGPSGAGKTGAALSFPGKSVVIDFDDRAKGPIFGCKFLKEKRESGDIMVERIQPWKDQKVIGLGDVYKVLDAVDLQVTKKEVVNVIVDSTTSMKRFFVNDSINRELKTSGRSNSLTHYQIGEAVLGQKQDHNYAAQCMLNIIYDNLKTFNCNVFISTHIKDKLVSSPTQEDPERVIKEGETITAPGQLATEIPSWFDEVWEFQLDVSVASLPPKRFVVFQGKWARTSMGDLGFNDSKGNWVNTHRLEITDKPLYEVLRPTLERMKAVPAVAVK